MAYKKVDNEPASDGGYGRVEVANSATQILASNKHRMSAVIQNQGTSVVYLGTDASVTTGNYFAVLKAGSAVKDGLGGSYSTGGEKDVYEGDIYGITPSGTCMVSYLQVEDKSV